MTWGKTDICRFGNPDKPYTFRPLLYHQPATDTTPERILIQYARRYFTGFLAQPRSKDIPPITEAQAEALDALHFLAEEHSASLGFQKGDIQYVNNLSIFHARNGFKDGPGQECVYQPYIERWWLTGYDVDVICYDSGCAIPKMLGKHQNSCSPGGTRCLGM